MYILVVHLNLKIDGIICMFASPIISVRTLCMFKMIESICILHNNFLCNNLGDKLSSNIWITAYLKILHNKWNNRNVVYCISGIVHFLHISSAFVFQNRWHNRPICITNNIHKNILHVLKWWNPFASFKTMSLTTILDINLVVFQNRWNYLTRCMIQMQFHGLQWLQDMKKSIFKERPLQNFNHISLLSVKIKYVFWGYHVTLHSFKCHQLLTLH